MIAGRSDETLCEPGWVMTAVVVYMILCYSSELSAWMSMEVLVAALCLYFYNFFKLAKKIKQPC